MEGRVTCLTAEWPTLHLETEAMGFRESTVLGFRKSEILMFWENWMKMSLFWLQM